MTSITTALHRWLLPACLVLALAVPAAATAQDLRSPDARDAALVIALRSPDARDVPSVTGAATPDGDGMPWLLVTAVALSGALVIGGAAGFRRRRARPVVAIL